MEDCFPNNYSNLIHFHYFHQFCQNFVKLSFSNFHFKQFSLISNSGKGLFQGFDVIDYRFLTNKLKMLCNKFFKIKNCFAELLCKQENHNNLLNRVAREQLSPEMSNIFHTKKCCSFHACICVGLFFDVPKVSYYFFFDFFFFFFRPDLQVRTRQGRLFESQPFEARVFKIILKKCNLSKILQVNKNKLS